MPVCTIRRSAHGDGCDGKLEIVGAGGMVEADATGVEVNGIGDVVPEVRCEGDVPMALAIHVPAQGSVEGALFTADEAVLHLGEVRLEEGHLVLLVWRWRVGAGMLHAEVVEDLALVDRSLGLWDQLRAEHVVVVPNGGGVDGNLDTLLRSSIGRVLEVRPELDILVRSACTVNVVLVWTDGVGEGPVVQESARLVRIEATVPEDAAGDRADQGKQCSGRKHV